MTPPGIYWGVDSFDAANSMLITNQTLFDYITQVAGAAPSFWGRYLAFAQALQADEAAYLHNTTCRILLIDNGTSLNENNGGSYAQGLNDAAHAISAVQLLGAPQNGTIAIFADVENDFPVTNLWIQGWADGFKNQNNIYVPGYYANTDPGNRFNQPFCVAYGVDANVALAYIYTDQPNPGCTSAGGAPTFAPSPPSCAVSDAVVWQYALRCYPDPSPPNTPLVDEDETNTTGFNLMW